MTDHVKGLRFDIYERIDLAEGAEGIQDLEEVELTPHIQLTTTDTQAVLHGNIMLTGVYTGDQSRHNHPLEHAIPVEITLPLKRIPNLEKISVEIDNFDIDVLSKRRLSVSGVLSLEGIQTDQPEAKEQAFTRKNEPPKASEPLLSELARKDKVKQHQIKSDIADIRKTEEPQAKQASWVNSLQEGPSTSIPHAEQHLEPTAKQAVQGMRTSNKEEQQTPMASDRQVEQQIEEKQLRDAASDASEVVQPEELSIQASSSPAEPSSSEKHEEPIERESASSAQLIDDLADEPSAEQEVSTLDQIEQLDEQMALASSTLDGFDAGSLNDVAAEDAFDDSDSKSENIKIAFSSQKNIDDTPVHAEALQQITMQRDGEPAVQNEALDTVSDISAEGSNMEDNETDERTVPNTEWMSFLLNRERTEERLFSKVRMCIVQKEDTLETIAERYELNPREIILYNRLSEQELNAGQVVYIPSKT